MRIFLPGVVFPDSFADNVASTLRQMQHVVQVMPDEAPPSRFRQGLRFMASQVADWRPTRRERAISRAVKSFRPDVFLSTTLAIHPGILTEIGTVCPGRRVLWWGDAPGNSPRWGIVDDQWDLVFVKDPDAVRKLRLLGRNAFLLHEAMNPVWHRPIAKQSNRGVVIAGNAYGFRQNLIRRLRERQIEVALYGPPLPRWSHPLVREAHRGEYIERERKSQVFGEGLACLNSFSLVEGNSLNCRAFEIAGAEGLQLIEDRPMIAHCFEPGKEVLVFATFEELVGFIERAAREPERMNLIREAAGRRARAEHTYEHRLTRILSQV